MTLHHPDRLALTEADAADDRRSRLIEAGIQGGCCEGDLLALMPSVESLADSPGNGTSWLRRVLGF